MQKWITRHKHVYYVLATYANIFIATCKNLPSIKMRVPNLSSNFVL